MTIEAESLFHAFINLEQQDKKVFLKQALSYLLEEEVEIEDFTVRQIHEVKRRIEAFESGKIKSIPTAIVEERLALKYGL